MNDKPTAVTYRPSHGGRSLIITDPRQIEKICLNQPVVSAQRMRESITRQNAVKTDRTMSEQPVLWRTAYEVRDGKMEEVKSPDLFVWTCVNIPTGEVEMTDIHPFDDELDNNLVTGWEWRRFRLVEAPESGSVTP